LIDKCVGTVGARKANIHKGDVRLMTTKFSYSFPGVRRASDEKHVRLKADDCSQSLTEDRMILYAQDTNGLGLNQWWPRFNNCNGLSEFHSISGTKTADRNLIEIQRSPCGVMQTSPSPTRCS
jgi:hypothetical protein